MTVRIMVRSRPKEDDRQAFEEAFLQVSETVRGTPGHIRDELLRDVDDGRTYVLLAEWESEEAFRAWEDHPVHRELAAPMMPFVATVTEERRIFHIRASLESTVAPGGER
jgi:heme-degrading monooxygenase HmoA